MQNKAQPSEARLGTVIGRIALVLGLVFGSATLAQAQTQTPPPPAAQVVDAGVMKARAEGKTVLIEFGASWCTWCRNFEAFVASADAGRVLAAHFVVVKLTVLERGEKQSLEHSGGRTLMERWGGASSGLPFYVFLDSTGQKVADSNAMADGTNIGYPAVPAEIDAFVRVMGRAAPSMSAEDRAVLSAYLTREAKVTR